MACNGEPMNLACDGGEEARVAVYSAHFASAAGSHMYCPVPDRGSGIQPDFFKVVMSRILSSSWGYPSTKRVRALRLIFRQ